MCAGPGSTTLHVVRSLLDYNVCWSREYHSPCCKICQTIMCAGPGSTTLHVVRSLSDYNVCCSREYHSLCILRTPFVNIKENKERKKLKHCVRYKILSFHPYPALILCHWQIKDVTMVVSFLHHWCLIFVYCKTVLVANIMKYLPLNVTQVTINQSMKEIVRKAFGIKYAYYCLNGYFCNCSDFLVFQIMV